ncbi:MAG: ABC transporter substrate-binding protein [Deltaproteobacteria bacterium]
MKLQSLMFFSSILVLFSLRQGYAAPVDEVLQKISSLPTPQRKAALEQGARQEGQIVFYTSVSAADVPKIIAAFEATYPFLKVNPYRAQPSTLVNRLETENRAGRDLADILGSAPAQVWLLKQKKLSRPYASPERQAFPAGSYDRDGYWAGFEVTPIVLAFNSKMVPAAAAPKNYDDLLKPSWKGKMSLGNDEYEWYSVMLDSLGKKKGLDYMKALAKQDLNMVGTSSRMRVELMLAGEFAVSLAARGRRVVEFKEQGAPADYRLFEPYPSVPNFISLMAHAPHPHASILFFDWLLSQEGQSALAQIPRLTIRKGQKQKGKLQDLYEKEFVFVDPASLGANLKELMETYDQIFGAHPDK